MTDTSTLSSLAVSRADTIVGTDIPDPLQYLLILYGVFVSAAVTSDHQDIHAATASNVPIASSRYTVADPYERDEIVTGPYNDAVHRQCIIIE